MSLALLAKRAEEAAEKEGQQQVALDLYAKLVELLVEQAKSAGVALNI
jgi:hypothetical protein